MYFVGRTKEIKQINRALEQRNNIIVQGKYGIGRTALVKHIAKMNQQRWRFWFADFSLTPEKVCRQLFAELFPDETKCRSLKYKSLRRRIASASAIADQKMVLVVDNIGSITSARIELLRYLFDNANFHSSPLRIIRWNARTSCGSELYCTSPARSFYLIFACQRSSNIFSIIRASTVGIGRKT